MHASHGMQDRAYKRKKSKVERFIKQNKSFNHSLILNEIDIDYDTLMTILSELKKDGKVK